MFLITAYPPYGMAFPVEWADIMRRPLKPVLLLFFYTIEVITASGSLPPIPDTVHPHAVLAEESQAVNLYHNAPLFKRFPIPFGPQNMVCWIG